MQTLASRLDRARVNDAQLDVLVREHAECVTVNTTQAGIPRAQLTMVLGDRGVYPIATLTRGEAKAYDLGLPVLPVDAAWPFTLQRVEA